MGYNPGEVLPAYSVVTQTRPQAGGGALPPSNPPEGLGMSVSLAVSVRKPRRRWLKIRLSEDELRAIEERARGAGVTKSEYLRRRLGECESDPRRRRPPRPRVLPREVREALLPLARLGNNLNQIARWENTRQEPAESFRLLSAIRELSDELAKVRRAVLHAPVASGQLPDEE